MNKTDIGLYILQILKDHSNVSKPLKQKDILDYLLLEYGVEVERKTIRRHLLNLIEKDDHIEYTEIEKKNGDLYISEIYYMNDFDDVELDIICRSVVSNRFISREQKMKLLANIRKLGKVINVEEYINLPENKYIFNTLDVINEAISTSSKISFNYNTYKTDKKLYPKLDKEGNPKVYVFNPYRVVLNNNQMYVWGKSDKYDNFIYYRMDQITNIQLLDEKFKKIRLQDDILNHKDYYCFGGNTITVRLKVSKKIIDEILTSFGLDVMFYDESEDTVCVSFRQNENSIYYWCKQYSDFVEVLSPLELKDRIVNSLKDCLKKYE